MSPEGNPLRFGPPTPKIPPGNAQRAAWKRLQSLEEKKKKKKTSEKKFAFSEVGPQTSKHYQV